MIGNDVVDLFSAKQESNWKRKGYLDKIYTSSEQLLINSASSAELMVWVLWSMKEASYKVNHRITGIREYAPIKIQCSITLAENNIYFGTTVYDDLEYTTKTSVCQDYIHTIALYNSTDFSSVKEIFVKNYPVNYIDYLKDYNYLMPSEHIQKDECGVPNLFNDFSKESKPISISHHGNFLILAFIKD